MSVYIYNERSPHPNTWLFPLFYTWCCDTWRCKHLFNTQASRPKFQKIHLTSSFVRGFFWCYLFWPCAVAADNNNGWKRSQSSNNYISFHQSGWGITFKQVLNFGHRRLRLLSSRLSSSEWDIQLWQLGFYESNYLESSNGLLKAELED